MTEVDDILSYSCLQDKKYSVIYADPPWSYRDKAQSGQRGASFKYKTQSDEWVKNLPVSEIAAEDCVLFLWITMPKLPIVFDVIQAWGFEYKTCAFTWIKKNKKADTPFVGMGNWTRSNAELCLLAVRGKPKRISASVSQIIHEPIEEHSKKPDIVRHRIVELCGDVPRIELFARQTAQGWDAWGDEL